LQLKIQFNVSKEPIPPPEPAPFDPVKIRNFLLFIITLLSLIGIGLYNMWAKEPKPKPPYALKPNTLNSPSSVIPKNAVSKNTSSKNTSLKNKEPNTNTPNKVTAQQPDTKILKNTAANKITNTASNIAIDAESDVIPTDKSQNNIFNNKSSVQTKTTLAISSEYPAQKTDRIKPKIVLKPKPEIQNLATITPTLVNKVEQKKAELLSSKQVVNKFVYRAQLTSNILSKEPMDNIEQLSLQEQTKLYLFTEIHGKNNQKIYHRWIFKKKLIAQITLNVRNSPWRTYSSKNFDETMVGQWEVQVVDQNDNILKTVTFYVSR